MKVVCAWCKETMTKGTETRISHGICQTCFKDYFPDLMENESSEPKSLGLARPSAFKAYILPALLLVLSFSIGCKRQNRDMPNTPAVADVLTFTGVTQSDNDAIHGVPVYDRSISVRVMIPGSTVWRTLNKYEIETNATGQWVWFKNRVELINGLLVIPGNPAVPSGSRYEITSTNVATEKELF